MRLNELDHFVIKTRRSGVSLTLLSPNSFSLQLHALVEYESTEIAEKAVRKNHEDT